MREKWIGAFTILCKNLFVTKCSSNYFNKISVDKTFEQIGHNLTYKMMKRKKIDGFFYEKFDLKTITKQIFSGIFILII